ncbi:MAG TPA: phosphate acyltransferase PlsX [Methylomirabilota bacterium]|nr:phosphate acyltransferase PlsX [Methylomirabilota bacterium]
MRIAVDVMGGDHGSGVVINGVRLALQSLPQIHEILLVGDQGQIESALAAAGPRDRIRLVHASEVITMEDKPLDAVRRKKDCSMVRAMELVRDGKAGAAISLGNTGALVAAATVKLRRLAPVERAPIATVMPSVNGEFVLVDVGANHECRPIHLVQFAIMGAIYSRELLHHRQPRVGILSNGREETKGTELTRETLRLMRQLDLDCVGYVEGHDLFHGRADVVVTDGFTGNIVLKTCEGLSRAIFGVVRAELQANGWRKLGAALARGAFRDIKRRLDPEAYGGAPLLGLNGVVIKAHGGAREEAIMNAVRVATETLQQRINDAIVREVAAANLKLGFTKSTMDTSTPAVA